MPTFEIPDGPTSVELQRSGDAPNPGPATGSAVFSVTNKSDSSCSGRLGIMAAGNAKQEWFSIEGDRERTFESGETQTATVRISTPKDVPAGDYPFRLRVVAVNDPDNDHAEGPITTAKAPRLVVPKGRPFPWLLWLSIALAVLAALGALAYFMLRSKPEPPPGQQQMALLTGRESFADWPSGPMWVGSGPRQRIIHVDFAKPFKTSPTVFLAMSALDAESSPASSVRVAVTSENVTARGFDIKIVTWADSRLATVHVSWLAYSQ